MKITKVVGIDIGNYRIKISYIVKGELKDVFVETLPDNIVKDGMIQYWDAMADFLKETFQSHGIHCRNVIFTLPASGAYMRVVDLPRMTVKQLQLNLPFEFHDYISEPSEKYFYDYAVIEEGEKTMKLLAVACSRELIDRYRTLAKHAKLNAVGLVPEVLGFQRVLRRYNALFRVPDEKDYAILDMGDRSFKLHFFRHGVYEVTRPLEPGARHIAEIAAEIRGTDVHIGQLAAESNQDDVLAHENMEALYESSAVQIMRAMNFYSYSNTNNTIDTLYYCGGAANYPALLETIEETMNLPMRPLTDLMLYTEPGLEAALLLSPQSYGVALDPEAKVRALSDDEIRETLARQEAAADARHAEANADSEMPSGEDPALHAALQQALGSVTETEQTSDAQQEVPV